MNIYFVYRKIVIGGCELLIERLGKELIKRSINPHIICQSIDADMKDRYFHAGIHIIKVDNWCSKNVISAVDTRNISYLIAFTWNNFLICNRKKENVHSIFYSVHYQALEMGNNKRGFIKTILQRIARDGIIRLNKNGQIICMDEQTIENTKKYYNLKSFNPPIIRIAIDCVPKIKRYQQNINQINILTIARADFPFKGYIIGLLNWLKKSSDDIYLTIISYGRGEGEIHDIINSMDEPVRRRVSLVGKTDYYQLEKYYQEADLYVGMGTTVLDASLRGVVSIPVQAYTFDLITNKYLFEDYSKVALDCGSKNSFNKLVEHFKQIDYVEKNKWSELSRKIVMDYYGTKPIVDNLVELLLSTKENYSSIGMDLLGMYHDVKMH